MPRSLWRWQSDPRSWFVMCVVPRPRRKCACHSLCLTRARVVFAGQLGQPGQTGPGPQTPRLPNLASESKNWQPPPFPCVPGTPAPGQASRSASCSPGVLMPKQHQLVLSACSGSKGRTKHQWLLRRDPWIELSISGCFVLAQDPCTELSIGRCFRANMSRPLILKFQRQTKRSCFEVSRFRSFVCTQRI